ncbi:HIRAN domain-containing protein [Phocaeicola plebeius]|uniref:HIRAN domain-containing protein n=1 Tax=Phocaeicola plebeius TaxID=310297 RepID=UPI0026ECAAB4|nr:HIRAN domain-containing protein [Phocaeicola plebeius]
MIGFILIIFLAGFIFIAYLKKSNDSSNNKSNGTISSNTSNYDNNRTQLNHASNTQKTKEIPSTAKKVNFAVKGTSYRSQADINAARNVRVGDELTLIHEAYNDYDSFAMMVLTSDGHHIGYVEKKYSMCFFAYKDKIYKCIVSKVTNDDVPFIYANAFLPFDARVPDDDLNVQKMTSKEGQYIGNGVTVKITTERSLAHETNPDLELAEKLKYSEPEKAVEIFLSCAANESGLYSLHQACFCYRKMKAYDKEKELIQQIIAVCKDEGKEEYIPEYESRLKSVEYYINKQNEKGELDKAYSLQKEGKYKEALDLYLFYFNKDKFVLNLTDRIIQCYRKLNDKSNETRMLEYALKNKLSESNKLKYEKRLEKLKQEQ